MDRWHASGHTYHGDHGGLETDGRSLRVAVVDDEVSYAEMLGLVISAEDDLQCAAVAHSLAGARDALRGGEIDVVILDVRLPDADGIDAVGEIRAMIPKARVLLLTGHGDVGTLLRATESGASGFLVKNASVPEILNAIRAVGDGAMVVARKVLADATRQIRVGGGAAPAAAAAPLTRRELDVLTCLAQGMGVDTAARALSISPNTCHGYLKTLYQKLSVHSRLEAVVVAVKLGLISVGQ